jgi:hypothetical protein
MKESFDNNKEQYLPSNESSLVFASFRKDSPCENLRKKTKR